MSPQSKWHEFPISRRWNAKWIWTESDGTDANTYVLFRKIVHLDKILDEITAFIAADTRYELYVNGQFIGRGAPQSQPLN